MWSRAADLDSALVGVPQISGASESLHVRLENREIVALIQHTLWQPGGQEKNQLSLLSVEICCKEVRKNFPSRPYKMLHSL